MNTLLNTRNTMNTIRKDVEHNIERNPNSIFLSAVEANEITSIVNNLTTKKNLLTGMETICQ